MSAPRRRQIGRSAANGPERVSTDAGRLRKRLSAAYQLAAHIKDVNRERDLIHADLGDLLEACGLGNYARPESSHEVMQQAIAKVRALTNSRVLSAIFACNSADCPRPFALHRGEDVTGVSGTGTVAHGVQFADGTVVIRWLGEFASTVVWESLDAAMKVHGHDGRTRVVWVAVDFSEMALAEKEAAETERTKVYAEIRQLAITEADRLRGGNFGPLTPDVKALLDFAELIPGGDDDHSA